MSRAATYLILTFAALASSCDGCGGPPAPGSVPAGGACTRAIDCQGDLVCEPDLDACTADVVCDEHSDCGAGAVCANADVCARDTTGGQAGDDCASTANCDGDLVCDPGTDECAADVACTTHADCGALAYCTVDGQCAQSVGGSPCDDSPNCIAGDYCFANICIPEGCYGEEHTAEAVPPNMLIVLDRSGSMDEELNNSGGQSKWDVAKVALSNLVEQHQNQVRFGLMVYPGTDQACEEGGDCSVGLVPFDIAVGSPDEITDWINLSGTCNFRTPTAETLRVALQLASLHDPTRANYILLVTDGAANCDDPVEDVENLANETPPILTYVVGFGSGIDEDQLTDMANAGGKPRLDGNGDVADPNYYLADDPAALDLAFETIVGDALGCDYDLDQPPADPDEVYIYFDGVPVPRDPTGQTGWDYTAAAGHLRFAGGACDALQQGIVDDLVIVYGCPIDIPPPVGFDAGIITPLDGGPGPGGDDAGPGPGGECDDRCVNGCGTEACLIDTGECGPCRDDGDCCPGSLCNASTGQCIFIGG